MSEATLFAPVCSITSTRRRRFLWAAWWSAPPEARPFRKPDAFHGGARSAEEAHREAEKAAGMSLVLVEPKWARAWARVMLGAPAWPREPHDATSSAASGARPEAKSPAARSVWDVLGVTSGAAVEEIKRAYKRRALETHPDRGGSSEAFREVAKAYASALARRRRAPKRRP